MRPRTYRGRTIVPLTRYPGGLQAYKQIFPGSTAEPDPAPVGHEGYEWFCVLSGRLRLILGDKDVVLGAGEIAEFDTHVPHWIGSVDGNPVEILNLFGPQGERAHTTARTLHADDVAGTTPRRSHGSHSARARYSAAASSAICRRDTSAERIACDPWNVPRHWCSSTGTPACSRRSA